VPTFAGIEGYSIGLYTGAATFSSKKLLSCTHEAEWTPFQTTTSQKDQVKEVNELREEKEEIQMSAECSYMKRNSFGRKYVTRFLEIS
jgi:hypothetical protein